MMGGYLSFPLLCLQSYLAARWATRDTKAKFLVNGDDTLIASTRAVADSDYPSGFRLNVEKTIRAQTVVEVNSTVFLRGKGKWREVHHLRRGGAFPDYRGMLHLAAAVRGRVEWTDAFIRSRIGQRWGFLPSQLGLHPASLPAFHRQFGMGRYHTDLPSLDAEVPDFGIARLPGSPDADEIDALSALLWERGRPTGDRVPEPPSHGKLRRTFGYREPVNWRGSKLTYLSHLKSLTVPRKDKVETYSVPADYVSKREDEAIRRLSLFIVLDD